MKRFQLNDRVDNFARLSRNSGIIPSRQFDLISRVCKLVRDAMEDGMEPVKRIATRSKTVNELTLPKEGGRGPRIAPLLDTLKYSRLARLPKLDGIEPVNLEL